MLILTRKPGEGIRIGEHLLIRVQAVRGRQVRLGIDAPEDVKVIREEIEGEPGADSAGDGAELKPDLAAVVTVLPRRRGAADA